MGAVETWIADCGCQHLLGPECPCGPVWREDEEGPYMWHNDPHTEERVEVAAHRAELENTCGVCGDPIHQDETGRWVHDEPGRTLSHVVRPRLGQDPEEGI